MTISSIFSPRAPTTHPTFWGPPTSSVNWCELDYTITLYLAEFFNSLSSLCMVLFGLLGNWSLLYLYPPSYESSNLYDPLLENPGLAGITRVKYTWYALQLVGWGSVAFHGSLQWWTQALDEVPMVWTAALHLTTLLVGRYDPFPLYSKSRRQEAGWRRWLIPAGTANGVPTMTAAFLIYAISCSLLVTLFRGPSQFLLFHLLFGTVQFSGFYYTYQSYREVNGKGDTSRGVPKHAGYSEAEYKSLDQKHKENVRRLHNRGVWYYGIAILIWSIDLNFCPYVSSVPVAYPSLSETGVEWVWTTFNPQGHAWWHLLVSFGFYHLGLLATYDRLLAGYKYFWKGVEEGEEACLELIKPEKVGKRKVTGKGDVPVLEWIGPWQLVPMISIKRY
ncbi:hypothetical protein ABW19_dt0200945 [Dactylella cylindrospora]|nr:hypothetical protein ABW19_dt0200945 [Dactylella cylindrospora]